MRSLLVTFDYPPMVGGMATLLGTLWECIGSDEHVVLAPGVEGARSFDRRTTARVVRFPAPPPTSLPRKALGVATGWLWAFSRFLTGRPRVVIAGQVARAGSIAWAWRRLSGCPYYVFVYGGETGSRFTGSPKLTRMIDRVLREADLVLANSSFTRAEMIESGIEPGRVVELTHAHGPRFRPDDRDPRLMRRYGLGDELVLLTVGRLVERKGVDTTLRALERLADALPPFRYLVVGDGPHRERLERLADELGLGDETTFTGFVPEAELPAHYNLCDLFVMPNREVVEPDGGVSVEGFGIVFLEAAACGKPVIAGRSGGAIDAVDDGVNGILVDPHDPDDLAAAIRRLADPEAREAMGRAGIEHAGRFSWEATAGILRDLLEDPPTPP